MLNTKRTTLKPILESADGVHLTAYLVNRGDLSDLKLQLQESINSAYEWLNPVMSIDERNKFLEPLDSILKNSTMLKDMRGNIGLFRNKDFFRILNIPIEVEPICQVATSFHVKPLLKWLQIDQEFLILGLEKDYAHLYLGGQSSLKLIDLILFPEAIKQKSDPVDHTDFIDQKLKRAIENETFIQLNELISQLTKQTKPKLFLAGEKSLVRKMKRRLTYENAVATPISFSFDSKMIGDLCKNVRMIMREYTKRKFEKGLFDFRLAEDGELAQKNIFQIARAVVKGRVRKLLISDDINIFGKIDKKTGGISIHPFALDHEDDDLLDDLAQMVLSQGGEVLVAKKDQIPKGRSILAILDNDEKELERIEWSRNQDFLQERFG
jgi:hypothetical protein